MAAEFVSIDGWWIWRDELADGGDRWYARSECGSLVCAESAAELVERIAVRRPELTPPFRLRDGLLA